MCETFYADVEKQKKVLNAEKKKIFFVKQSMSSNYRRHDLRQKQNG
jgi:hypothetical protein